MRPLSVAAVASTLAFGLGCLSFPSEVAYQALDYRLDRPRVLAIRVDPPILVHGVPVSIDALVLGPPGTTVESVEVGLCGLSDERMVRVFELQCFDEPDLVQTLGRAVPLAWEPPDLSQVPCDPDTGVDSGHAHTGDTADTGAVGWHVGDCYSSAPLLVTATVGGQLAYGALDAPFRLAPFETGEAVPTSVNAAARSLTVTGDARPGAEVALTFAVAAEPGWDGFRWWVDGGELLGTGRTAVQQRDGDLRITHNTLRIPEDWEGPLRVVVTVQSQVGLESDVIGDVAWEILTLDVRP